MDSLWTEARGQQKQSNDPSNNQHNPQYATYWAPHTRKRHIPPHPAQPQHTNYWAPRTRKRHQREHRPQRPTERSDPTQHAKGRTGDCPGPRKEIATRRTVTRGDPSPSPLRQNPAPPPPPEAAMDCGPKHHSSRACAHQSTPPPDAVVGLLIGNTRRLVRAASCNVAGMPRGGGAVHLLGVGEGLNRPFPIPKVPLDRQGPVGGRHACLPVPR